jgi:hypothetical protein
MDSSSNHVQTTYTYYCEDGILLDHKYVHKSGSTSESLEPVVGSTLLLPPELPSRGD